MYTVLKDAPVPVPPLDLSSIIGFTKPNTASVIFVVTILPWESVVASPICFFLSPIPTVIIGSI